MSERSVKSFLISKYFKSSKHVCNHINYLDKQSPVFNLQGEVTADAAIAEYRQHSQSQVWRHFYSMTSQDVERLGVDRDYMKSFLVAHRDEIAKAYNISPDNLRAVASFHNLNHHPHLHIVMYSTDKREGYLRCHNEADNKEVMNRASEKLKSVFHNEIFKNDTEDIKLYKYSEREELNNRMRDFIDQVATRGYVVDPVATEKLKELNAALHIVQGRAVYGYLPPPLKRQVDDLLEYIVKTDKVAAQVFENYSQAQFALVRGYVKDADTIGEKMQEWQQSFFHPRKGDDTTRHNMIIRAAQRFDDVGGRRTPSSANSKEIKEAPKDVYREKIPANVTKALLRNLCHSIDRAQRDTSARQQASNPKSKNRRLRKITHRQNRDTNVYEP